jgi:hypothetical protein
MKFQSTLSEVAQSCASPKEFIKTMIPSHRALHVLEPHQVPVPGAPKYNPGKSAVQLTVERELLKPESTSKPQFCTSCFFLGPAGSRLYGKPVGILIIMWVQLCVRGRAHVSTWLSAGSGPINTPQHTQTRL